jgi:predicted enzyme related to lactoylglutathione lyase
MPALARSFKNQNYSAMSAERNPVGWFEIYVDDMARAQRFYESVFNVKLQALDSPVIKMLAFPMKGDLPGCPGALVKMPGGGRPAGNAVIIYFTCADCATEAARAAQNGGKIFKEKFSIGQYGFIALVHDTEGNMIGLHSRS